MTSRPIVSIIMPSFNRLKYLSEAVDSVFSQSFDHWQLLIADDGSDAETRQYLRALDDGARVKVLWLAHSGNPAAARNAGLREATGEFVAFLDSDDLWLPEKLQQQVALLVRLNDLQWSYTGFSLINDAGISLAGKLARGCAAIEGWILEPLLREEALVVTPSVMVRREFIEKTGGYNDGFQVCEDYELWLRLASNGAVGCIDEPLVRVRRHQEHSFDDISCLKSLMRVMETVQRSNSAAPLDALLTQRRAKIAASLARSYAASRRRTRVLQTVLQSAQYSWRCREWRVGCMTAVAKAFAPPRAFNAARRYRRT